MTLTSALGFYGLSLPKVVFFAKRSYLRYSSLSNLLFFPAHSPERPQAKSPFPLEFSSTQQPHIKLA